MQMTQNIAGMNITQIESDFCKVGICFDPFIKKDSLLVADVAQIAPVFQPVPGKGNFFEEELAKQGASDKIQIYGQIATCSCSGIFTWSDNRNWKSNKARWSNCI